MEDHKPDETMTEADAPEVIEPVERAVEEPETPVVAADAEPEVKENEEEPVAQPAAVHKPAPAKPKTKKRALLVTAAVLIIALLGGGGFWLVHGSETTTTAVPVVAAKSTPKAAVVTPKPAVVAQTGFTDNYLDTPQSLTTPPTVFNYQAASDYFDCKDIPDACSYTYYKLGTTKDGKTIIVIDDPGAPLGGNSYVGLVSGDKTTLLGYYSGIKTGDADFTKILDPSVTLDGTTTLPDLKFDAQFTFRNTVFKNSSGSNYADTGEPILEGFPSAAVKIGDYGNQSIYQLTTKQATGYKVLRVFLAVKQVYQDFYSLVTPLSTEKPKITWSDGSTNVDDTYTAHPPGCGSGGAYLVADSVSDSDLTKTGTASDGSSLYTLATSSALFQEVYNVDYGSGTNLSDDSLKNLTADQFQAKHGMVLLKDGLGEYVAFLNESLIQGGGCGKPVVYLYPTQTEQVNVAVGADVQKSEPTYPVGGWQHVIAQPSGQLTYQGQTYPNLYWEGTGHGQYPVVDSGTVVAVKDAPSTIRKQLAEQGLTSAEINDFMDFWQPKLPHTKYVRLTWFDTAQMNELAPLKITPQPTTTIRVFLDFQGLNRQIPLATQHLTSPPRLGFTAVEWGGLDRSGAISH